MPRLPRAPTPRPGVASIFVGLPRDPGETTSEIPHLPPAASPEATSLVGSQAEQAGGTGGLPRIVRVEPTLRERIESIDISTRSTLGLASDIKAIAERMDARDAERHRDAAKLRAAQLAEVSGRTRLERTASWALNHRHSGRLFAVLTWLGGMACMAVLDYLGLESEPIFRFVALVMGAL